MTVFNQAEANGVRLAMLEAQVKRLETQIGKGVTKRGPNMWRFRLKGAWRQE
jgi:hypothetical protein